VQRINNNGAAELHKAADHTKDQSYFLFATTQEQLEYVYFPLGGLKKEDTRKMAEEFGLSVADKPDSQDICFVPNGSYAKVIERMRPGAWEAGDIMHVNGKKLGTHEGIVHYTIGQRKGLGVGGGEPLYVVKLDAANNKVIVGSETDLASNNFRIRDINWLGGGDIPENGLEVTIKTRSTQTQFAATVVSVNDNYAEIKLPVPQRAIAPGQACVMYDGTRVLGGGWIIKG